jgi:purine-binding chemotaxis protein CheW
VALPAGDVESVVEIEAIVPVPGAAPHLAGLAALRSRVVTVVDCAASLEAARDESEPRRDAVVAVIEGHPYALLVDGVEDVVEVEGGVEESTAPAAAGWRRIARGLVHVGDRMLLLVDVAALVAGPAARAA